MQVCSPLSARSVCTFGRARCCVGGIIMASVLYNLPRFFEVTWDSVFDEDTQQNITIIQPTQLRLNSLYIRFTFTIASYYY